MARYRPGHGNSIVPHDFRLTNNDYSGFRPRFDNVRNHFGAIGPDDGTLDGDAFPFDGVVNIDDLNGVRNNFAAGTTAVPEPSAIVLLLLGAIAMAHCRGGGRPSRV